jgi:hypothetical protein
MVSESQNNQFAFSILRWKQTNYIEPQTTGTTLKLRLKLHRETSSPAGLGSARGFNPAV